VGEGYKWARAQAGGPAQSLQEASGGGWKGLNDWRRGWGLCPGAGEGVSPPQSAPPPSPWFSLRAKVPFPAPCCSRVPGLRQRWRGRRDPLRETESGRRADLVGADSPGTSRCLAAACSSRGRHADLRGNAFPMEATGPNWSPSTLPTAPTEAQL
jgi:hypothetical protein